MQPIIERIISDAKAEADALLAQTDDKAKKLLAEAAARAENERKQTEAAVQERVNAILEKREADARLESAKILLAEKGKTVDNVYRLALERLKTLSKEDCMQLYAALLDAYAEENDAVYFGADFAYAKEIANLPIVAQRKLRVSMETLDIDGGLRLVGKVSDKDLSFGALLAADKEEYQAQLAKRLFS